MKNIHPQKQGHTHTCVNVESQKSWWCILQGPMPLCCDSVVVRADADALDGLAAGVRAALVVVGTGLADESAVLVRRRGGRERALRGRGDTGGDIGGARSGGALGRAKVTVDARDLNRKLVGLTAALGVLVVRGVVQDEEVLLELDLRLLEVF